MARNVKAWGNAPGKVYPLTRALKARHKSKERPMPQSLSSVLIHLVFSTKNREPLIAPAIEPQLHPYMASVSRLEVTRTDYRRHNRPSSYPLFTRTCDFNCRLGARSEDGNLKMDQEEGIRVRKLSLAKRLRRIFNRSIASYFAKEIHSQSETASPAPYLPRRISEVFETVSD
jgi:hypothetical protein